MTCVTQADISALNFEQPNFFCGSQLTRAMKTFCHPEIRALLSRNKKSCKIFNPRIVDTFSKLISKCFQQLTSVTGSAKSITLSTKYWDTMKMKIFRVTRAFTAMTGCQIMFTLTCTNETATSTRPLHKRVVEIRARSKCWPSSALSDTKLRESKTF